MRDHPICICLFCAFRERADHRDGLLQPGLRIGERAGRLTRIAPFVEQLVDHRREGFVTQAVHAFDRLHTSEAELGRKRKHVRCQPRGQQRLGLRHAKLRGCLVEPLRQSVEHLDIGWGEQLGRGHRWEVLSGEGRPVGHQPSNLQQAELPAGGGRTEA